MQRHILLDTGPLVAFLKKDEPHHQWVVQQWQSIEPPLLTCEAVIAESCFLMQRIYGGKDAVLNLLKQRIVQISFDLEREIDAVRQLLSRYDSVPISLADGCWVRMAELKQGSTIMTFDSDFMVYRKNRNQVITLLRPDNAG